MLKGRPAQNGMTPVEAIIDSGAVRMSVRVNGRRLRPLWQADADCDQLPAPEAAVLLVVLLDQDGVIHKCVCRLGVCTKVSHCVNTAGSKQQRLAVSDMHSKVRTAVKQCRTIAVLCGAQTNAQARDDEDLAIKKQLT